MAGWRRCWWRSWWRADELLEEAHVEDVVEAGARWELEQIGDIVDDG